MAAAILRGLLGALCLRPVLGLSGPVEIFRLFDKLIYGIIAILFLALIYFYWNRIILFLTGDPTLHYNCLQCLYRTVFQCCGTCNGDWTRMFTSCACVPLHARGTNLVKTVGQALGVATYVVELRNIVCGDLPFHGMGDFFLAVDCTSNPPMVTSVVEEGSGKVVVFPEVITVRLRSSMLESMVKISVKELKFAGHETLCEVCLSPQLLLDWSNDEVGGCVKRFQMREVSVDAVRETPPWICMEISEPSEVSKARAQGLSGHQTIVTAKTTTQRKHQVGNVLKYQMEQDIQERPLATFKDQYQLVNSTGYPVDEPREGELSRFVRREILIDRVVSMLWVVGILAVILWLCLRFYVWSCYTQFKWLTVATVDNPHTYELPVSHYRLGEIRKECAQEVGGTLLEPGEHYCKPLNEVIEGYCEDGKQRPVAFMHLLWNNFHISIERGAPCWKGVCKLGSSFQDWDRVAIFACLFVLMLPCLVRCLCHYYVRRDKNRWKKRSQAAKMSMMASQYERYGV